VRAFPKEASFIICGAPRASAAAGNATSNCLFLPQKGGIFSGRHAATAILGLMSPAHLQNRPDEK
jgi:hypothetical protein